MSCSDWIQLISSGAIVILTAGLVWATWKYMRSTKRMADSMETQTAIMVEGYERNIAPVFKASFGMSSWSKEEVKIKFYFYNFGKEIITAIKVITKIWNIDNADRILQESEQTMNFLIIPNSHPHEFSLDIPLNPEVSRFHPDRERKIKWESLFVVKDVKGREHTFHAGVRSLF
jgi:hypothetical protein